ncbi:helix-hairpin-helix domain-containing protein [Streptomyces sp. NPDC003077]|uniref:DNA polymerase Y family protein n=1 Tax=Streptomyces sp. NPDC003077 TaxID=3154443 RepID=UPI0033BDC746
MTAARRTYDTDTDAGSGTGIDAALSLPAGFRRRAAGTAASAARPGAGPAVATSGARPVAKPGAGAAVASTASAPLRGAPGTLYVRFRGDGDAPLGEETYAQLIELLEQFTPVVEALPPDAALADTRGAQRYFGRDAAGIAELVRLRALAWHGVRCTIGIAANPSLARMAAQAAPPGEVRAVPAEPEAVAAFLARKPAAALHGVGPATARTLCSYGLDSVGRIAAAPPATLQRILGAKTGRTVYERARGVDPTPVTPNASARSMGAEHRFPYDELDEERRRRALLTLADDLGSRMRGEGQVARALTLTVRYADRSTTTRTRRLTEPTAHGPALTEAAYALHAALGLQRARVRAVGLRAEGLCRAELATHQLMFDPADDKARRIEAAVDRARARFGEAAVRPAAKLG